MHSIVDITSFGINPLEIRESEIGTKKNTTCSFTRLGHFLTIEQLLVTQLAIPSKLFPLFLAIEHKHKTVINLWIIAVEPDSSKKTQSFAGTVDLNNLDL